MDAATKNQLLRGQKLTEVLKQPQYKPLSVAKQVSILFAANEGFLDDVENKEIQKFKDSWFEYFEANMPELRDRLDGGSALSDEDKEKLRKTLTNFKTTL